MLRGIDWGYEFFYETTGPCGIVPSRKPSVPPSPGFSYPGTPEDTVAFIHNLGVSGPYRAQRVRQAASRW